MKLNKPFYDYVIFHKKCLDGYTGFIILHNTRTIKHNALIFPDVPSAITIPRDIDNKNIIIIDVAYKYEVLREIVNRAKSVTFIDHHITIVDDVAKIKEETKHNGKNINIFYNEKKSGASLTWEYFHPKKPKPLFVKFIEDNDTGSWKIPNCLEFITALQVKYPMSLKLNSIQMWKKLYLQSNVKKLINIGKTYMEYKNYISGEHSKRFSLERFPSEKIYNNHPDLFTKPGQYKIAVYNGSPCPSSTDVFKMIIKDYNIDFFLSWVLNLDRKEYVFTFRSENVDVGNIAKIFNGGGHTLAAAGSIKMDNIEIKDLFFGTSLPRS